MKRTNKTASVTIMFVLMFAMGLVSCKKEKTPEPGVVVQSVSLLCGSTLEIGLGDFYPTDYIVTPAEAADLPATWSSDDDEIVQVSGEMKVIMGVGVGTTDVTVEVGGVKAVCTVTVKAAPIVTVLLNDGAESISVTVGKTNQLTYTVTPTDAASLPTTWSSEDESIATVSDNGLVTGVAVGKTKVKLSVGTASASIAVNVSAAPPTLTSNVFTSGYTTDFSGTMIAAIWNDTKLLSPLGTGNYSTLNASGFDTGVYVFGGTANNGSGVKEACLLQTTDFGSWTRLNLGAGKASSVTDIYPDAGYVYSVGSLEGHPVCWKGDAVHFTSTSDGSYYSLFLNRGSVYACGNSSGITPECYLDIDGENSKSGTGARYSAVAVYGSTTILVSNKTDPRTGVSTASVMVGSNSLPLTASGYAHVRANCVKVVSNSYIFVGGCAKVSGGDVVPVVWTIPLSNPTSAVETILKNGLEDCNGEILALADYKTSTTSAVLYSAGYVRSGIGVKTACYWKGKVLTILGDGQKPSEATSIFVTPSIPGKQ